MGIKAPYPPPSPYPPKGPYERGHEGSPGRAPGYDFLMYSLRRRGGWKTSALKNRQKSKTDPKESFVIHTIL